MKNLIKPLLLTAAAFAVGLAFYNFVLSPILTKATTPKTA